MGQKLRANNKPHQNKQVLLCIRIEYYSSRPREEITWKLQQGIGCLGTVLDLDLAQGLVMIRMSLTNQPHCIRWSRLGRGSGRFNTEVTFAILDHDPKVLVRCGERSGGL
jgi:hypothetical protein